MMCKPKKMLISNNSVLENSFLFWHVHTWRSALFSLDRCVTWRSLRRVDIRPCRGCATSPKMEVGEEFSNTYAKCPYVQLLGNSWAMQCNAVGTNLELMQFYEKGIQCRTWGSVATSCEMCESELFFFFCLPWSSYWDYQGCTCWVFLLMLPLIAKHPHLISFVFHSFWVDSISCLHLISLRFPLFFVHLIKSCPFPPQITSSGPSRQRLSRQ